MLQELPAPRRNFAGVGPSENRRGSHGLSHTRKGHQVQTSFLSVFYLLDQFHLDFCFCEPIYF